jgi:integrase
VNVDLKTLRTAFNHDWRQGIIENNPVNAVELPKETRHQRSTFSSEQLEAIINAASGEWKSAILFGYYLGARIGDAVALSRENIDFHRQVICYTQAKTKKTVTCPSIPNLNGT